MGKDVSVRASSGPGGGFSHQLSASEKPLDADLVWFKGKHVAGYYNNPDDSSHAYVIHSQGIGRQVKIIRFDFLARERGVEVIIYRVR